MKVVCIHTAKGGVGKSTAAANLAASLAVLEKQNVLLLDLDAQASASRLLGVAPKEGLLDVLIESDTATLVQRMEKGTVSGVRVLAGGGDLATAERQLASEAGAEQLVRLALDRLREDSRWDAVVIDCAPGVSALNVGALVAASLHVAPCEPSPLGMAGLTESIDLASTVGQRMNPQLQGSKVLLSRMPRTRAARLIEAGLREQLGEQMYRTTIPERAVVVEASAEKIPVIAYAPEAPVSVAFMAWAREVYEELGLGS